MSRSVLPSENCVFRLDSDYKFNQAFPMTFADVDLSDDGFEFNGSNSISLPADKRLELTTPFSIEVIINPATNVHNDHIFTRGFDIFARIEEYGIVSIGIYDGAATKYTKSVTSIISTGSSYHVVYVWDGSKILIYVNGQEVSYSVQDAISSIDIRSMDLFVGKRSDGYGFDGTIPHVSIYSCALTAQEASDRYNKVTFRVE